MKYLWILYCSLVVIPTSLAIINEQGRGNHSLSCKLYKVIYYISLVLIILVPVFFNLIIDNCDIFIDSNVDTKNIKTTGFFFSAVLSIISVYFNHMISIRNDYMILKKDMASQMAVFTHHPILNSKESLDVVITSLYNLSHSREEALDFFSRSIREIKDHGAIRINATFLDYTTLLISLMENAEFVIGTFTTPPKAIKSIITNATGDSNTTYKKYFEEQKKYYKKIYRICVFEDEEINEIYTTLNSPEGGNSENDLKWFKKNVKSKKLKWTETKAFIKMINTLGVSLTEILPSASEHMLDFAIFDDILLRWSPDNNDSTYGTINMLIGTKPTKLRDSMKVYIEHYGYNSFEELHKNTDHSS